MSLDLQVILIVLLFAAPAAFVGYWAGVGASERRHKTREAELLADLDFACSLLAAEPATPVLRVVGGER